MPTSSSTLEILMLRPLPRQSMDTPATENPTLPQQSPDTFATGSCSTDSTITDGLKKQAKSCIFEIFAANSWNPPRFDSFKEEGPGHHKLFTFKVTIEVKGSLPLVLECIGNPQSSKKKAAEDAAEGALWYLMQIDFSKNPQSRKKRR